MIKRIINSDTNEISLLLPEDLKDKVLEVYIIPRDKDKIPIERDEIATNKLVN